MVATRGRRLLRAAPLAPVLVASAVALALLGLAATGPRSALGFMAALLGVAGASAAAAYVLDERAVPVLDATPTSRSYRVGWRLLLVLVPASAVVVGLGLLAAADPDAHWWRLGLLAAGGLASGVGAAALLRGLGREAPGDVAGVVTALGVVFAALGDPLKRWVSLVPLGDVRHVERSVVLYTGLVGCCAVVVLLAARDPGRGNRERTINRVAGPPAREDPAR
jgi:hypothetical protein